MQKWLINRILEPIGVGMEKVNRRLKEAVFVGALVTLFIIYFLYHMNVFENVRYIFVYGCGCAILLLMAVASIPASIEPVRFHRGLAVCWAGCAVFITISAFVYNIDYISDAIIMLIVLPILYIIWGRNWKRIFKLMNIACIISFVLYFVALMLFAPPHKNEQYGGLFVNVNEAAFYYALVFGCLLIEIFDQKRFSVKLVSLCIALGLDSALLYYTNSRTGLFAAILCLLICSICHLHRMDKQILKILKMHIFPMVLAIVIFIPSTLYVLAMPQKIYKMWIPSGNTKNIGQDGSDDSVIDISGFTQKNRKKTTVIDKNIDQVSSGRISIWRAYIKRLNLTGHDISDRFFIEERASDNGTAHMLVLEYAYRSGIVAGVLYLAFNIWGAIRAIRLAWKKKVDSYLLAPLALTVIFGVISGLSSVGTPFLYMSTMYYYFYNTPIVIEKVTDDEITRGNYL